ncbi:MAG TPA: hypothetical protein ENN85_04965 [Methanoculleus sp.]|nr:hypothetical protein [Methanoculleus sp.]
MSRDAIEAAFEAGIKLGALYHQWVGTPISPRTAPFVETAIEKAVALQPFVEEVVVRIDVDQMIPNTFGYSELAGRMFNVEIVTKVQEATCRAALKLDGDYPMMRILECDDPS